MTGDQPDQVARCLTLLKPVVDQINVAVDSRVDERMLGSLLEVSDQLWRFDFRPPVDRPRAWLASRCTADWIFWIDGDEIPSPDLLKALRQSINARDVLQFVFTRRWPYPDHNHWIEECPWWPDFQIRLVRNDPATMWFGNTHQPIGLTPPFKYLDAPLYHLAALAPLAKRMAKIERYETERPGMVSPAGGPFNGVLLRPECHASRQPATVPFAHRDAIRAVFEIEQRTAATAGPLELATPEAIDALSPARRLHRHDYRASIQCIESDTRFAPGVTRDLLLSISNEGKAWWPWGMQRSPCIHISYHLLNLDGSIINFDGPRTFLPSNVFPGDTVLINVRVDPPTISGRYFVDFDLVHENVRWFKAETRVEIEVKDRILPPQGVDIN